MSGILWSGQHFLMLSITGYDPTRKSRREVVEYRTLFSLDACCSNHLAPLLGFVGNEFAELGGRECKRRAAQIGKPCLQLWVGEARVDHRVDLVNDTDGCVPRCAQPKHGARLIT